MLLDAAETVVPNYDPEAVVSLTKFSEQLPSVFNEVPIVDITPYLWLILHAHS